MLHDLRLRIVVATALATMVCGLSACTSPREYFRNGFKVGPSYGPPAAPLPKHWIDHNDENLKQQARANLSCWWAVFNDPQLNQLVVYAYRQNLSLRKAGYRVLEARAQRSIVVGNIFPQQQTMTGSYNRIATTANPLGDRFFDSWNTDFNLSWELDFWGRFRRSIAAANDDLDVSVANYDQVIVTLLADVASSYVQIRTDQQRIKYLVKNVKLQTEVFDYIGKQREAGFRVSDLEYNQAKSNLYQTKAAIPQLMIDMRQAENRLCVLLGMPVVDIDRFLGINLVDKSDEELLKMTSEELEAYLNQMLGKDPIPRVPADIVVNLPADLLRQRPDVRAAERAAASQGEKIGIAQADLYPSFFLNGSLGYSSEFASTLLFQGKSFNGSWGPSFQWNLLNYGRIINNVRLQDAMFRELVLAYQETVLQANMEAENGIVTFLRSQDRALNLGESVNAARVAVDKAKIQYEKGAGANKDLTTYAVIQQNLVTQEDTYAQSVGQIAQGLIQVYRALGGGWEIRFNEQMAPAPGPTLLPPVQPLDAQTPEQQAAPQAAPVDIPKPSDQP